MGLAANHSAGLSPGGALCAMPFWELYYRMAERQTDRQKEKGRERERERGRWTEMGTQRGKYTETEGVPRNPRRSRRE